MTPAADARPEPCMPPDKYLPLFEQMNEGFCIIEVLFAAASQRAHDYRFLEVNPAFERQTGLSAVVGRRMRELAPLHEQHWFDYYGQVALSGEPARFEQQAEQLHRWYDVQAFRVGLPESRHVAILFRDITARRQAEAALRANEERQAFLLALSDALGPLTSPLDIQATAARVLGQRLGTDRAYYVDVSEATQEFVVAGDWHQSGAPSHARRYPLSAWAMPWLLGGETWVCHDVDTDPTLPESQRADYRANSIRAAVVVPLLRQGRLAATLVANQDSPRAWTPLEIALVEETVGRTWTAVERARAEEALRASEQRQRALLENLPGAAVFIVDETLRYQLAEGEALRQAGHEAADFLGRSVRELAPPELWPDYERLYRQALAGHSFQYEHTQGGRTFATRGEPLRAADGAVAAVLAVSYDISARKQAEAAVQASEARFRIAEEASNGFIYDWTPRHDTVLRSAGFNQVLGYAPGEVAPTATAWLALIHPGDRAVAERLQAPTGDAHVMNEYRVRRRAGTYAYVLDRSLVLRDTAGQIERIVGSVVDISERRQAERALQESERKYRTLFDSIDEGYCLMEVYFDAAGQPYDWCFVEVNPAFEKNSGLRDVAGKTIRELAPDIEPKWFEHYGRVARTGEPLRFEDDSAALDGRWFSLYVFAVGEPGDNRVAVLFTDITARKHSEEALRLSQERLQLALQAGKMGSFEWTAANNRLTLSSTSEEIFGLLPGTNVPTHEASFNLIHAEDRARHRAIFERASQRGEDFHSRYRIVRPRDGKVRWVEERGQGIRDPATGFICLRGVHWDATEQVLAQQQLAEFNTRLEQRVARRTAELQASRDLLRSVFDTNLIAMSVLEAVRDEAGAVQDLRLGLVNKELERETGRSDLVGKLYAREYPGIRESGIFDLAVRALTTGQPQGMDYYYPHEGFDKWFACQFVKLGDGVVAINLDITERKKAEQERTRNLRLLEQAEAVAGLGSWDYDLATSTMRWSDGMYHLFGLPPGSAVSPARYLEVVLDEDRPWAEQLVRQVSAGQGAEGIVRLRVQGQVKTVRLKAVVLPDELGQPWRVLGVDLDISQLQRLEQDNLRLRLRQQQDLFEAVQAAQEAERKRIAEGLHNGIGQLLYATKLRIDQLHVPVLDTAPALVVARQEADRLLAEAIRQTRALSHELVPLMLEEFGLPAALHDISRKMSSPHLSLRCQVWLDEEAAPIAPALQLALYRMAQELALNIIKHAHKATEASLEVETTPGWVLLRAEDNGPGFVANPVAATGLGLRSIRDRVKLLGGAMETGTSAGAYVRIRLPLCRAE